MRTPHYTLGGVVHLSAQGKLLFCHPPPGVDAATFNPIPTDGRRERGREESSSGMGVGDGERGPVREGTCELSDFDKQFLKQVCSVSETCVTGFTSCVLCVCVCVCVLSVEWSESDEQGSSWSDWFYEKIWCQSTSLLAWRGRGRGRRGRGRGRGK